MKKLLALLLLLWMPLQASLAAFEEVHGHHDHAATFAAHEHGGASTTLDQDDSNTLDVDCAQDCSTSHLCNAQLLFLDRALATQVTAPSVMVFADYHLVSPERASPRPERPQWFTSSH